MSLSRGEVNPLGVLKMRQLSFIPEHFTKISVPPNIEIKLVEHWISYNLNSRFAVKKRYNINQTNKMIEVFEIGLEDPKEVTMLTLGCPYLYNKKDFV
jgi:hypothetical protein